MGGKATQASASAAPVEVLVGAVAAPSWHIEGCSPTAALLRRQQAQEDSAELVGAREAAPTSVVQALLVQPVTLASP